MPAVIAHPGSGYRPIDVISIEVEFPGHNGDTVKAFLSKPREPGVYPGIVQATGVEGLDDHLRDMSRRLAVFGYIVVTPSLFSREEHIGIEEDHLREKAGEWVRNRPYQQADGDLQAALEFIKQYQGVNPDRIGTIGFCSGGSAALSFACSTTDLSCVISCYPNNIIKPFGVNTQAVIDRVKNLSCPLLGLVGKDDPNPSQEDLEILRQELDKHGKSYELVSFNNANHAFLSEHREPRWRPAAAHMAWGRILEWFDRYLTHAE